MLSWLFHGWHAILINSILLVAVQVNILHLLVIICILSYLVVLRLHIVITTAISIHFVIYRVLWIIRHVLALLTVLVGRLLGLVDLLVSESAPELEIIGIVFVVLKVLFHFVKFSFVHLQIVHLFSEYFSV